MSFVREFEVLPVQPPNYLLETSPNALRSSNDVAVILNDVYVPKWSLILI